jgi:hypothetical protein
MKLTDLVTDLLEKEQCPYERSGEGTEFRIYFHGRYSSFSTLIFVDDDHCILRTYSKCPVKIPNHKLLATTELIARINFGLSIGNFDLDIDERIVLFRTAMKIFKDNPGQHTIGTLIFGNCLSMDRFSPVIASVIYGNISPKKAIDLFPDSDDEISEEQENKSSENNSPKNININRRRGLFSDN